MPGMSKLGDPPPAKPSDSDQADLDALNASIDRMRNYTSQDPYILTIPHDVESRYRHAYQYQAMQWLHQAPFEYKEGEYMQYQTFIYHEHSKDMFVLHPSKPKEEREAKAKPATGANTPSAGPKKKITLNAYKKKLADGGTPKLQGTLAGKTVATPAKQAAVKGPVERVKAETDEVLAAVEMPETEPVKQSLKRKRSEIKQAPEKEHVRASTAEGNEVVAQEKAPTTRPAASPARPVAPAAQAVVLAAPSPIAPIVEQLDQPATPPEPAHKMDASLPPRLSPLGADALPTRLSPTIPANMEATLKAREQAKASASENSAPGSAAKNDTLTPPRPSQGITKRKSPIPLNAFRASSSSPAVRSDVEVRTKHAATATTTAPRRAKTPELSQNEEIAIGQALKERAARPAVSSRIVKLKYRKARRQDVKRILNMPSKGVKTLPKPVLPVSKPVDQQMARRRDPTAKGVAQKVGPPARKQEIKRYEPPGRRKNSTTDAASEVVSAKHKRRDEGTEVKGEEPPPKRRAVPETGQDHEPATKRQKMLDKQQDKPAVRPRGEASMKSGGEDLPAASKVPQEQDVSELAPQVNRVPLEAGRNRDLYAESQDTTQHGTQDMPQDQPEEQSKSAQSKEQSTEKPKGAPIKQPSEQLEEDHSAVNGHDPNAGESTTEPPMRSKASPASKEPSLEVQPVKEQPIKQQRAEEQPVEELPITQQPVKGQATEKRTAQEDPAHVPSDDGSPGTETTAKEPPSRGKLGKARPVNVPNDSRLKIPVIGELPTDATTVARHKESVSRSSAKNSDSGPNASAQQPDSTTKRRKIPEAIKTTRTPSTPVQPPLESPALLTSAQKSSQVTPALRKDHLFAVAMAREGSTEGTVNTPSSGASSTPVPANGTTLQPNGTNNRAPSSQPAAMTPAQQAWETERKRLEVLGRDLKHAASAHAAKPKIVPSDAGAPATERKLAAARSIESLLAYFLAFTAADEAALAAEPKQSLNYRTWKSLLGFFAFVKHTCEPAPLLHGLACHLGVVFAAHILDIAQGKQAAQDAGADTHIVLIRSAKEADVALDCDALAEAFPKTWQQRSKATRRAGQLVPGAYQGEYKLPLGVQTSPVRAARAGYAMLEEWLATEKLEYEMKLRL
ncbi:hypothetical protein LTR53_006950 [Teratosphaeriaceae sp. CCFEE 6253]|nr:hypothetical protein LTR53_006950 [Teratosphaeriaceae sp. CCFEE 6253]